MNTKTEHPRHRQARRRFLRSLGLAGGVLGAALLGFVPLLKAAPRLRPPGALTEADLLAACIKCGQCVQVCPVQAVKLADLDDGVGVGVPYLDARAQACDFSCDAVQCVLACPTGALSHEIDQKEQVFMGTARLVRPEACLARQGKGFSGLARGADFSGVLRYPEIDRWNPLPVAEQPYDLPLCDLCVRHCPIEGAISLEPLTDTVGAPLPPLEKGGRGGFVNSDSLKIPPSPPLEKGGIAQKPCTPVVHEPCTGCGVCEMMCPPEPAVIVVEVEREAFIKTSGRPIPGLDALSR